ncbi:hypothetical protein D8674_028367 [Pyrus ussuriensis x Pyrus communis]|uniref:TMV resistance protein N-like n=1 Tax=Pyrus ussuriensis x Pyrus communis TaxID=2448454 RepID=A0A5N5I399_9ROSA|nr:hypothetical protein D8674_028367 [Pyrus ussuriensis x Pyrus communis]
MTKGEPFETNVNEATWMFRAANLEFPEGVAPSRILVKFLDQLFQDSFEDDASSSSKEKFISCIQQKDLAWGIQSDRVGYERGLETVADIARQGVGSTHASGDVGDNFELFSELETKAGPEVEEMAPRPARGSTSTPQVGQASAPPFSTIPPTMAYEVTEIPLPQPMKDAATEAPQTIISKAATSAAAFRGVQVMHFPLASIPTTNSLPKLVREFGKIQTRLMSQRRPFEPQHLQDQRWVFKEWM